MGIIQKIINIVSNIGFRYCGSGEIFMYKPGSIYNKILLHHMITFRFIKMIFGSK